MSTYTQIIYHIVFATKNRKPSLAKEHRDDLYKYIWGIIKNRSGYLYRIGGVEDHVHILTSLHPTIALSDFVKEIKTGTHYWIKTKNVFPEFEGWQSGYGAFTSSVNDKDRIIEYIKDQEQHHATEPSGSELKRLLVETGIDYDEKYFE